MILNSRTFLFSGNFQKLFYYLFIMYMHMCVHLCTSVFVHMHVDAHGNQKSVLYLELQVVLGCEVGVGTQT